MIEKENLCISRPDNVSDYQLESTTQVFEKKMAFEKENCKRKRSPISPPPMMIELSEPQQLPLWGVSQLEAEQQHPSWHNNQ